MTDRFTSLPQSAYENLAGLARKMDAVEKEVRQMMNIPDDVKIHLDHCWDGMVRVWADKKCLGTVKPTRSIHD